MGAVSHSKKEGTSDPALPLPLLVDPPGRRAVGALELVDVLFTVDVPTTVTLTAFAVLSDSGFMVCEAPLGGAANFLRVFCTASLWERTRLRYNAKSASTTHSASRSTAPSTTPATPPADSAAWAPTPSAEPAAGTGVAEPDADAVAELDVELLGLGVACAGRLLAAAEGDDVPVALVLRGDPVADEETVTAALRDADGVGCVELGGDADMLPDPELVGDCDAVLDGRPVTDDVAGGDAVRETLGDIEAAVDAVGKLLTDAVPDTDGVPDTDAVGKLLIDAVPDTDAVGELLIDAVPDTDGVPDTDAVGELLIDAVPDTDGVPDTDAVGELLTDAVPDTDGVPDTDAVGELLTDEVPDTDGVPVAELLGVPLTDGVPDAVGLTLGD